jgi:two-component system, OmpR family, sensor histidine kinase VanS
VDRTSGLRIRRFSLARLTPRRMLHLPSRTVRLRLTLLYGGLFLVSGVALLATTYLLFRGSTGVDLIVPPGTRHGSTSPRGYNGALANPDALRRARHMFAAAVARNTHGLHQGLIQSGIALAIMTAVSIALGWLVAGRVLRPLRTITARAKQISERNMHERLALAGPRDELKDLADTVDGLLARLEAHVVEQQRFAANASHELRTPLALTQTLLDLARKDPNRINGELVNHLQAINIRAIDLTEALLVLSRADQRTFAQEPVDLSLIAEEATETLLPLAEKHRVTIETSGDITPTVGSHALLLQMTTNLVHNAIVHNLPEHGTVWLTTRARTDTVVLTAENTGQQLTPQLVSTLAEPFQRGSARIRHDHGGVGLGLAIVNSIAQAHDGILTLTPRVAGGLCVTVQLPATPRHNGGQRSAQLPHGFDRGPGTAGTSSSPNDSPKR